VPVTNLCPYCSHSMVVSRMTCPECQISVDAVYPTPRLGSLPSEHQRFIELFILAGGNLKQLAEQADVSYPTVRSRLDKVIDSLREAIGRTQPVRGAAKNATGENQTTTDEAAKIIKAV
jgi:hypothetical protein